MFRRLIAAATRIEPPVVRAPREQGNEEAAWLHRSEAFAEDLPELQNLALPLPQWRGQASPVEEVLRAAGEGEVRMLPPPDDGAGARAGFDERGRDRGDGGVRGDHRDRAFGRLGWQGT